MGPKLFFLPAKIAVGNLNKVAAIFAIITYSQNFQLNYHQN